MSRGFSGSYLPEDVTFLLKPITLAPVSLAQKEKLLQSGTHYSALIGVEKPPSPAYQAAFDVALERNQTRLAGHLAGLAQNLAENHPGPLTLLSLARAGTPIGVILARVLRRRYGRDVAHFSISIVRDIGLDKNALDYIRARGYDPDTWIFVDGWTAKGAIAQTLAASWTHYAPLSPQPPLYVVADLSGFAQAATADDYVIPSAILNATISGLVSRSIVHPDHLGPGDFHGCLWLPELAPYDFSRGYVELLTPLVLATPPVWAPGPCGQLRATSAAFLAATRQKYAVPDTWIKPGIGEATRVLLRRLPDRLLIRDPADPELGHLQILAAEKAVAVQVEPELPYRAVALIKNAD